MQYGGVLAMRRAAAWLVGLALSLWGCGQSHPSDRDAEVFPDGSTVACHIGPYPRCWDGCGRCESPDEACDHRTKICFRERRTLDYGGTCAIVRREPGGGLPLFGGFCGNGLICVRDRHPRSTETAEWLLAGSCVEAPYCEALPEVADELGLDLECVYSDLTPYVHGPPTDDLCPAPVNRRGPLCGPSCAPAACPSLVPNPPATLYSPWGTSCVGVSETRGVGVCSPIGWFCTPEQDPTAELTLMYAERFLCLNFIGADGEFEDRAWPVQAESCRQYEALYPGATRCLTGGWEPAP